MRRLMNTLALGLAIMTIAAMPSAAVGPPSTGPTDTFTVAPLKDIAVANEIIPQYALRAMATSIGDTADPWRLANAIAEDAATLSTSSPAASASAKAANTYFDNGDGNVMAARPPNDAAGMNSTTAITGTNLRRSDAGIANRADVINVTTRAGPRTANNAFT